MTAGAGILHEEFHSPAFTYQGGELEMIQLWVNLPAADKMTAPSYQGIRSDEIPVVPLADNAGEVRVIAGEFQQHAGAANTYSPMQVWDIHLRAHATVTLDLPEGWNTAVSEHTRAAAAQMVVLDAKARKYSSTPRRTAICC